jgi:hypothetical protein
MALTPIPDADTLHLDLENRPVCGQDLLFLQQWYKLSRLDMCYLLGLSDLKWCHYTNPQHVKEPLGDPAVALLVWALVRYPDAFFLPAFPTPQEVYPLYERLAEQSAPRPGDDAPVYLGKTTFSLLLGREIGSTSRWLSPTDAKPITPTVSRLLFVLKSLLQAHGAPGLEDWVNCAQREAQERGLDLKGKMTSWFRMDARPPGKSARRKAAKPQAVNPVPRETAKPIEPQPSPPTPSPTATAGPPAPSDPDPPT